jgi:hypothetical protein
MTLHEAIIKHVKEVGKGLTSSEIAEAINKNGTYEKKDKSQITSSQIHARVNKYPYLFSIDKSKDRHIIFIVLI